MFQIFCEFEQNVADFVQIAFGFEHNVADFVTILCGFKHTVIPKFVPELVLIKVFAENRKIADLNTTFENL